MEGAIRFALAAAALKVTRHGAQAGMPYRGEILKMMAKTQ
jgi:sugar/nucleoside kinase (ribokinase family)